MLNDDDLMWWCATNEYFLLVHHIFRGAFCVEKMEKRYIFLTLSWFVIDWIMPIYFNRPFNDFFSLYSINRLLTSWSLYICFIFDFSLTFSFFINFFVLSPERAQIFIWECCENFNNNKKKKNSMHVRCAGSLGEWILHLLIEYFYTTRHVQFDRIRNQTTDILNHLVHCIRIE